MKQIPFQGQMEIIEDETYTMVPIAFRLFINPDADPSVIQQAGRAIVAFLGKTYNGGGEYDY